MYVSRLVRGSPTSFLSLCQAYNLLHLLFLHTMTICFVAVGWAPWRVSCL